ncbi:uncharacterized protein LOC142520828 [Primulina tabacum]|uniref:uncharacterized protein LOC142520828 n=1 Tax=Primulina tabacum TaxID=48773 RepID=UPI003F5A15E4
MEFRTNSSKGHDKGKKVEKTRRVWTTREEEILLQALKAAISHGWKSENGFRIGYLSFLEDAMKKTFPNTDLRANPHINSKIHVWKKSHGTLMTLLSKSEIGWNETGKMIDATNEAWEPLEKIDSSVHGMRYRSWPFYNDWCEIFGRDRATGEQSESFVDAVQEDALNLGNTDGVGVDVGLEKWFDGFEDNADSISVSVPTFSVATTGKKSIGKKRKRSAEIEDRIVDAMNNFSDMTKISIEDLSKKIGYDPVATKDAFGAMGTIPGLTIDEKIFVADKLVENPKKLAFFFSLPDEARNSLVKQLLKKE